MIQLFDQTIDLRWQNLAALCWFLFCFRGYTWFAIKRSRSDSCLASVMHLYRLRWFESMLDRSNRMPDTAALANLERSVSFFASSTMLVVAGIVTILGASDRAHHLAEELPFVAVSSKLEWQLKLFVLLAVFVYAFFKFTWGLRQYGFVTVMVGGAPMPGDDVSMVEKKNFSARCAKICSMAAHSFNFGLRSYYFGLALLAWFISPYASMLTCVIVVGVLYTREFKSSTLRDLMSSDLPNVSA